MTINPAEKDLRDLAAKLRLPYSPQDWGIEHSDPSRLREFINEYNAEVLTSVQKYHLYELIVCSANDALVDGVACKDDLVAFRNFLVEHGEDIPVIYKYWSTLAGDEFPVSKMIREIHT